MITKYSIYKGLQRPLVYRGFKGKFIGWGIGFLILGLVGGGLIGALTNMYLGGTITILIIAAGLTFTFYRQKAGLHDKTRYKGISIHSTRLKKNYVDPIP
ncbi:DUF4133 domain-containing protein [Sphingobacterium sp. CZ-UAM]|uniref:DUF4133 domain-containing protein n=1 Tax=Sphingobacterium sp. CZ-UAM TaxID=1933868 RepID=UPI0009846B09|nr:DUF4133 domain-containing protein [Sphingobacterium sp. CZ-UAM]OOG19639.1 DUF4133 domain-containing protein [Sphingobacterium sp. CZ-UAM]